MKLSAVMIVMAVASLVRLSVHGDDSMKQLHPRASVVATGVKDVVVCAKRITGGDGTVLGFHFEVINTSADTALVLVVREDIRTFCRLRLVDGTGRDISVWPDTKKDASKSPTKDYRHNIVAPLSGNTWFVPIPRQVKIDGQLVNIAKGQYRVTVSFVTSAFRQDKQLQEIEARPTYETLKAEFPEIGIAVAPQSLASESLIGAYVTDASQSATTQPVQW